uniref:C2H2-type domain-containing protein n=2 Tax=Hucho hucho TaxID=62062 RepID=A0A4W5PVD5_9TELE
MSVTRVLHQRISSVMGILASAAVTEICKLVDDCCGALRVEVSQSKEQILLLEKQLSLVESRYRSVSGEGLTPVTSGSPRINSSSGDSPAANADDAANTDEDEVNDLEVEGVNGNQDALWKEVSTAPTDEAGPPTLNTGPPAMTPDTIVSSSDIPRKQHITSFRVGETPKIQPCTTCCSLYHCPFCRPSAFKPNELHRIIPHIQSHLKSAVQNDEYIVYNCKLTCRDYPHYHCSYCDHVLCRKALFIEHFRACRKRNGTPRPARVQAQSPSVAPPPQQHPSPAQRPLAPATSTPVLPLTSIPAVPSSSRPATPPSLPVALQTLNTDTPPMEKTDASASHNPVTRQDSEPSSPEAYSCPPTPQIETERPQRPSQRDAVPVQTQCDHCGIILNKKNFKVHMKRKHHEEYIAAENEEALRRYLAESKMDVPPWCRATKVQCDLCGIRLNKKNFKNHMKRKHKVNVTASAFQEAFDRCLGEQGLLVVESSLPGYTYTRTQERGGGVRRREERDDDLFPDIDMEEEQSDRFPDAGALLAQETDLVTQQLQGERVLTGMNPQRYHGLGKPHLLELPLESLVWIIRDVLRVDGKRGYWNLSLVCRTFNAILTNEIIRKYSTGKVSIDNNTHLKKSKQAIFFKFIHSMSCSVPRKISCTICFTKNLSR